VSSVSHTSAIIGLPDGKVKQVIALKNRLDCSVEQIFPSPDLPLSRMEQNHKSSAQTAHSLAEPAAIPDSMFTRFTNFPHEKEKTL
jgi:hypothetical protein